jgi:hypothetical protein
MAMVGSFNLTQSKGARKCASDVRSGRYETDVNGGRSEQRAYKEKWYARSETFFAGSANAALKACLAAGRPRRYI